MMAPMLRIASSSPLVRTASRFPSMRALVLRYGVAVAVAVVAAVLWRTAVHRLEADPYPLLLAGVSVAAFYGGLGPGLVTTGLSAVLGFALYQHHNTQLDLYVVLAAFLTWLNAPLRRYQEHLRHQIGFTKAITRNLAEGVCVLDRRGRITYSNPAAEKMLGWNQAELRNEPARKFLGPTKGTGAGRSADDLPMLEAVREGASVTSDEAAFVRKDGKSFPVSYTASPITRGKEVVGTVIAFRDVAARNVAVEALRESSERYQSLIEASPSGIILTDMYGFIIMANQRAAEMHGYSGPDELCGVTARDLVASEDRQRATEDRQKAPLGKVLREVEYSLLRRDGSRFPAEVSFSIIRDENGEPQGLTAFVTDISERKLAEERLRANEARLTMQFASSKVLAEADTADEAVWKTMQTVCEIGGWEVGVYWSADERQNVLRCRDVWHAPWISIPEFAYFSRQLTFGAGEGPVGSAWEMGKPSWLADVAEDSSFGRTVMAAKENLHAAFWVPLRGRSKSHGVIELLSTHVREPDEPLIDALTTIGTQVGQFIDRKAVEEAFEHQTLHDGLTDLPNRTLLTDRLAQAVLVANRSRASVALLLMDLDRFKEVNDTLGHRYGDLLLQEAGIRLRDTLRRSDSVARLGGDEFALLLPDTDAKGAAQAAEKVLKALGEPFVMEGQSFDVGVSIGIALCPLHGEDANSLLRRADVAMYMAKRGGSGYALYDPDVDEHSPKRIARMSELRRAIDDAQMLIHYQPKVNLSTRNLESVEALVRWNHPEHGLLPPEQFVQLAEHVGLIQVLSVQVLSTALRQCRAWREQGINTRVGVNLSASTLRDPQLVGMVAGLIRTCEAHPSWLELEIAESSVMADPERAKDALQRLRDMGVRISLDEFGKTGTSLAHLQRLPVDEVKIDKSFVLELAGKSENLQAVRTIIEMARALDMSVVADGVPTREVWDVLCDLGCSLAQGLYVGAPLPPQELAEKFSRFEPTAAS
jgi:diguanylate cyclase (GGDEF)-like protein/PAS domain S-box-containing protein